jgi:hypothetical protein
MQSTLFHGNACEALGEDAALEVVDWAARRLLWLNSRVCRNYAKAAGDSPLGHSQTELGTGWVSAAIAVASCTGGSSASSRHG